MTGPKRLDETIPGGRYLNQDETRWIDANGKDLGPVDRGDAEAEPKKPAAKAAAKKDASA